MLKLDESQFLLNKEVSGYDVVYNPKETHFLSNFKDYNRIYGIKMLVNQAAHCFEDWFGKKPPIDKDLFDLLEKEISK